MGTVAAIRLGYLHVYPLRILRQIKRIQYFYRKATGIIAEERI